MKNRIKLLLTLLIAAIALLLTFVFHLETYGLWLVTIASSLVALSMFVDMIKTLKSGKYGIDLLAILAIGAPCLSVNTGLVWSF